MLLIVVVLTAISCHAPLVLQLQPVGRCGSFAACTDGEPARIFIGRHCPGGVCGFTCEPGRWEERTP